MPGDDEICVGPGKGVRDPVDVSERASALGSVPTRLALPLVDTCLTPPLRNTMLAVPGRLLGLYQAGAAEPKPPPDQLAVLTASGLPYLVKADPFQGDKPGVLEAGDLGSRRRSALGG